MADSIKNDSFTDHRFVNLQALPLLTTAVKDTVALFWHRIWSMQQLAELGSCCRLGSACKHKKITTKRALQIVTVDCWVATVSITTQGRRHNFDISKKHFVSDGVSKMTYTGHQ